MAASRAMSSQMATGERFAAGEADLPHAHADECGGDAGDLVEVEQCLSGKEGLVGPELVGGMQYVHRQLQRSVTEMRRSRSARPRRSGPGSPAVS
jgi:hypothetical protein